MKKSQRLRALLELGYFPEELPPPFNTKQLAHRRAAIFAAWDALGANYPKTMPEIYSISRRENARRNLSIVNPIGQMHLSKLIVGNWTEIKKHLAKSKFSIEIPDILNEGPRAVLPPERGLIALRTLEISAAHSYALECDISRFYGTLYTHAIPWALHSKSWCKQNIGKGLYDATLGARIDKAVRKGQDNQTLGIPIGPDTSRIISEIVAVALDEEVNKSLALDRLRAFRFVDDWYIGFDSVGDAEAAATTLATSCRDFELELNYDKTSVSSARSPTDKEWPAALRGQNFSSFPDTQARQLDDYISKAFHYAARYPNDSVVNYAVQRTRSVQIAPQNWHIYEGFLLRSVRQNCAVFASVVPILVSYNFNGFPLNLLRISKLVSDVIATEAPAGHHSEVSWALFLAKAMRIKIPAASASLISKLESSVCALIALDLEARGLVEGQLDKDLWKQSMNSKGLVSSTWLLAYEATLKGWLVGTPANFVSNDRYFRELLSRKVSFYDVNKNVAHIRSVRPKPPSAALARLLTRLRGVVDWDVIRHSIQPR